jgi:two-component system, NarL family, response regulator NreC
MSVAVLLVDDHAVIAESLSLSLDGAGFSVVGIAGDGLEAVRMFGQLRPRVTVLDVGLPGMNGFDVCREIRGIDPESVVILLTGRVDDRTINDGIQCGANALVSKTEGVAGLVSAIRLGLKSEPYISNCLMGPILTNYRALVPDVQDPLTVRERQILQLVAEGQRSKEIGDALHLSTKTVETHRSRLMEKLNLHNVADLVRYAVRHGLINA